MIHVLKIEPHYLDNLVSGLKKCEIRYNDRDYQKGDVLQFWSRYEEKDRYFKITHIHSGLGMGGNYVALSLEEKEMGE